MLNFNYIEKMSNSTYYNIILSYEIPYNILDVSDQNVIDAKEQLFRRLKDAIPTVKYNTFSVRLTVNQLNDTMNYIVTYEAYCRPNEGLPMEEYVEARDLKDNARKELESFFSSVDCDYKQLNIKTLL